MKITSSSIFLDIIYCLGLIIFLILFFFEIKIIFLTYFIVILSFTSIFFKLLRWQYQKIAGKIFINEYQRKKNLRLVVFCILINITPVYCIIQQPSLVVSHFISMLTLSIVTILAIAGFILERRILNK